MQYAPTAHVQPHEPFARQHATMPSGKQLWLHVHLPLLVLPVLPALPPVPALGVLGLPLRPASPVALEPPACGASPMLAATLVPAVP
jgi:hypothetical protein